MNLTDVIKQPVVTEKAMKLAEKSRFTLLVDRMATKGEIKQAVEKLFKVKVVKVTTAIMPRERKVTGRKRARSWGGLMKKAMVQLAAGQTIAALAGSSEEKGIEKK